MMRVKVSENVVFYWKGGKLICDDFVAHEQVALSSAAEPLLRWFATWKDLDSLQASGDGNGSASELTPLAKQLLGKGILVAEGSPRHRDEERLKNWDVWRQSAKYFHFSLRTLSDTEFLGKQEDRERLEQKAKAEPPPPTYKEYRDAPKVALPAPLRRLGNDEGADGDGLLDVLLRRRTCRSFDPREKMTKDQVSNLLYYAFGATKKAKSFGSSEVLLKTSPSGGARHPIEVYPCVLNVDGVAPGIYHYSVKNHELELIAEGSARPEIAAMSGDQDWTQDASVVLFYTAVIERSTWKYQSPRVYRVLCMDLGHLSQTFFLLATWLNLDAFFVGALREEPVERRLGLDWSREIVLGASGVGHSSAESLAEKTGGSIETVLDPL